MRLQRYGLIILTTYLAFIIGYGLIVFEIRWFNHILLSGLSLAWLGWRIKNKRGLPPSPLNIPMLALITVGFISVLFSYDPRMALEKMWSYLIFYIAFLFILNSFQRAQHRIIIENLFLMGAITVILSIIQTGSTVLGWGIVSPSEDAWINFLGMGLPFPFQEGLRIYLPLGVSTQVAGFVSPLIIICFAWAMSVTRKSYRYILAILGILLGIILILTFSRGGLVSISIGLFAFFILRLIQPNYISALFTRRNLITLTVLLGLIATMAIAVLAISTQSGRRSGDSVRFDLWQSAVAMTVDNPITGVGTGLYGRELREYRQLPTARDRLSTAHNMYLNTVAENGLGIIIILFGTVWIVGQSWWRLRQDAPVNSARWIRLNGMMAALIAFAFHNMFDTLNTFASMFLFLVIIIYCTEKPATSRLEDRRKGNQFLAILSFIIFLAYAIWFVAIVDPAHSVFNASLEAQNEQLALAQEAHEIDPYLNLYQLQIAYLMGEDALENPTFENLETAIQAYEEVLILEPTWDIGMINLAALYELSGNLDQAQAWLDRARNILPRNTAPLHWARIADLNNYDDDEEIILAYIQGMQTIPYPPLSDFWTESTLRREALERYMSEALLEEQYRIASVHFPERLASLVPENPETATEFWVLGEHALTINNDTELAITAFTNAIDLNPTGDYYASRARAYIMADEIELAQTDLQIADFLRTVNEYPNAIRVSIASTPAEIVTFRTRAIPQATYSQNFEAVLFNRRRASFIPYRPMRFVGRGNTVLQVWFDLAEQYEAEGNIAEAINTYENIAFYAPENNEVLQILEHLRD